MYFITGNKNKFNEVAAIVDNLEQLDIELAEVQDVDPHVIISAKLGEAQKHFRGECIVEDTSLYLECLQGLPGPLIKWFLKTLGNEGLVELTNRYGNNRAIAKTVIGYADNEGKMAFFEGTTSGLIVSPRGESSFGWDPIFVPEGKSATFAEMSNEEKNALSMRAKAAEQVKAYILNKKRK